MERCVNSRASFQFAKAQLMIWINRIFGPPHEFLHLLALWLIGRRAVGFSWTHVDIPDDLSVGQYVFVAGLPALVFWVTAAVGGVHLMNAANLGDGLIGFAVLMVAMFAGLGTMGDIQLILMRVLEQPPDDTH
jgi:UDP-N-acetylmuramyl pentapeptide phosphotransferase/UDP-N-acetylglucosamine-1-phosphate transferase